MAMTMVVIVKSKIQDFSIQDENRSLLLLFLLVANTSSLVATNYFLLNWGLCLLLCECVNSQKTYERRG